MQFNELSLAKKRIIMYRANAEMKEKSIEIKEEFNKHEDIDEKHSSNIP
jgi:hypothetical protein